MVSGVLNEFNKQAYSNLQDKLIRHIDYLGSESQLDPLHSAQNLLSITINSVSHFIYRGVKRGRHLTRENVIH